MSITINTFDFWKWKEVLEIVAWIDDPDGNPRDNILKTETTGTFISIYDDRELPNNYKAVEWVPEDIYATTTTLELFKD